MTDQPMSPGPNSSTTLTISSFVGIGQRFSQTWMSFVSWPLAFRTPDSASSPWFTPGGQSMFG